MNTNKNCCYVAISYTHARTHAHTHTHTHTHTHIEKLKMQ